MPKLNPIWAKKGKAFLPSYIIISKYGDTKVTALCKKGLAV